MILDPLSFPFFQRALAAAVLASVACGVVGTYVVVKRISSISGGLSHAAFGGVGLGYLLGIDPMIGATAFAVACGIGIGMAERKLHSGLDTLIAMVWAVGMALGILFISLTPGYAPDLLSYLFGSLLFVPDRYVWFVALLDLSILVIVRLFYKEFQAVAFDEPYATVTGLPVAGVTLGLLVLISLAVVTLIKVVGVILVIALLTIPAAIARPWSSTLGRMMFLAAFLGVCCSAGGLYLSYWLSDRYAVQAPTGPLIILLAVTLYGLSSLARRLTRREV